MKAIRCSILLLATAGLLILANADAALAGGCTSCGCDSCQECPKGCGKFQCDCQCDKVCEPKQTTKKVKITCWECVCKKVCLVGKSCGCQGTCGRSRVVKHLVRKTITKEVPIVKCEAVDAAGCGCGAGAGNDVLQPPAPPSARREPDDRFTIKSGAQDRFGIATNSFNEIEGWVSSFLGR